MQPVQEFALAKTCLVCGEKAGSAEHIFPAALGGRRTNRGIYCEDHNNGYSPLAARLAQQLEFFNAQLGVLHDRTRKVRPARMTEVVSGQELLLTGGGLGFAPPDDIAPGEHTMPFSSMAEAKAWAERQRAKGREVEIGGAGTPSTYHPGTSRAKIELGGPEGLRAVGYVGQTFMAHAFPDMARAVGLQPFVKNTYEGSGETRVWWDFDRAKFEPASPFEFGHRIVVGFDAEAKLAHGRVSLFGAFDFAMIFGPVDAAQSVARIFDIDPLAERAPADLCEKDVIAAPTAPTPPADAAKALRHELESGGAAGRVSELQRRIQDRERTRAAARLLTQVDAIRDAEAAARITAFKLLVGKERQRIWSMLRTILSEFEQSDAGAEVKSLGLDPSSLGRPDPSAPDGLSDTGRRALDLACDAMAQQFQADFESGSLTQERIRTLIADGEGHAIVLRAALALIIPGLD